MTRHTPRNGVNAKVHFTAVILQKLGELFNHVLRLRYRHAIARNDRHVGGGLKNVIGVFHRDRLDLALNHRLLIGDTGKAREQHVRERPVHRFTHDLGKDDARGTHQRARDNQRIVVDRKTRRTSRQARVGVQQRDHHRHVCTTDGDHRHDAEYQSQSNDHIEPVGVSWIHAEHHRATNDAQYHEGVDDLLAREGDCTTSDGLGKLAVGHQRTGEGHATDQNRQHDRDQRKGAGIGRKRRPTNQQ